jgi:tRNA 2-thiouridine synthesizing protein A
MTEVIASNPPRADAHWDAGHMSCGELVRQLRARMKSMPGQILCLVVLDASAPLDIAAWCRMTRNDLIYHDAAARSFWIRSRLDW